MHYLVIAILLLLTSALIDIKSSIALFLMYLLGIIVLHTVTKPDKHIKRLYNVLYIVAAVYLVACYTYMKGNNYQWLFAYDTYNYFLPSIEQYIKDGNYNYLSTISEIYQDFDFFKRNQNLYFVYSCLWGIIAHIYSLDLYYTIQLSVVLIFTLTGIVIYKIILLNNFSVKQAFKYTIIICTCSTIFFYSSQILRDMHILLLSLISIYYTFKPKFSIKNELLIIVCILAICSIRIESGLFMFILIPAYQYIHYNSSSNKIYKFFVGLSLLMALILIASSFAGNINTIISDNNEYYIDDISEGSGVIGTLQKIPIIGNILSIIYNALQPIPMWARLSPNAHDKLGIEAYNIMGFVRMLTTFMHFMVIAYIMAWLFNKGIRNKIKPLISKPMKVQLWIGFIFLYLQAAVITQRRLMPYYCIFYILFFIIYSNTTPHNKKLINCIAITMFIFLQIISSMILVMR